MRVLLLGGTAFLGRHLVDAAVRSGHDVTVFTRGRAAQQVPAGVEHVIDDRELDLSLLGGREFDAAIDTSGYVPRIVRESARALAEQVERYLFVSSVSVYDEAAVLVETTPTLPPVDSAEEDPDVAYGPLKARCEQEVEAALPGRALVIRPGLIVGRYDYTGRFSYWPWRIARGGEVLAPGEPGARIWVIDVRDLAEWMIRLVETRATGIYNAAGPGSPLTLGELLDRCTSIAGSDARLTWIDGQFLLDNGVAPWIELPLWLPGGFPLIDIRKAVAAGLTFRPIGETIRDVLDWQPGAAASPSFGLTRPDAGLTPEREQGLLAAWRAASA